MKKIVKIYVITMVIISLTGFIGTFVFKDGIFHAHSESLVDIGLALAALPYCLHTNPKVSKWSKFLIVASIFALFSNYMKNLDNETNALIYMFFQTANIVAMFIFIFNIKNM
ncbi:MAG: hypothetical protein R3Y43_03115 [Alphaproteobacteria bacterium]